MDEFENVYLSLSLFVFVSPGAEAVKILVEKPADEPERGETLVHQDITPEALQRLRASVLAEYPTAVLVEIAESDLSAATDAADELRLRLTIREDFDRISVNGYDYPSGKGCPDLPGDLTIADYAGGVGLYLVQTVGPPIEEWSAAVTAAGEVIHFLPANTHLIRADPAQVRSLLELPAIQHVEVYQPAFKVHPRLVSAPREFRAIVQLDAGQDLASVTTAVEAMIEAKITLSEGGPFENLLVRLSPDQMRSLAKRPEVLWIEPYTRPGFSDERHAMVDAGQHDHDKPNPIGQGVRYHSWLGNKDFCTNAFAPEGCISYSTKVAIFDTGIDKNSCFSVQDGYDETTGICSWDSTANPPHWNHHPDFGTSQERFFCIELPTGGGLRNGCRVPPNPPGTYEDVFRFSDKEPHGTAVASLIVGDPFVGNAQTDPSDYYEGTGIAPNARLVTARLFDEQINRVPEYSPDDYERLMAKVYGVGARFANNSWNEYANWDDDGDTNPLWPELYHAVTYNTFSQMMDMLVRDADGGFDDHDKPITVVFSAGNYKWEDNVPPYPDPNPLSLVVAPANAKNIISVGASDGWEHSNEGRQCCYQYGDEAHDCDDPVDPDDISNVIALSMRGTGSAIDRFKPDLVAPGLRLRAAQSRGAEPVVFDYTCFGGTSGAAPQVTGAAVLVDAWYEHTYGVQPSPAMVKALLTAHAADLGSTAEAGIDRLTGQALPHSPSLAQGWGRFDLDTLLSPSVVTRVYDEDHTPTGPMRFKCGPGVWSVGLEIDDPNETLIIALAYTDRYGATSPTYPVVNNLDLAVIDGTGPAASYYYGNVFAAASALSRRWGSARVPQTDHHNNVEMIRIDPAEILNGDFTVRVKAPTLGGKAVPGLDHAWCANQDFALYVYNAGVAE